MGVVYQVKSSQVIVCLPGRSTGAVGAMDISGPYTSYLENYRSALDTCGDEKVSQFVLVFVCFLGLAAKRPEYE